MGNPDLSLKSGFQIWQSNAKYKTDFTLTPREIFHQIMTLWVSFIPFQLEKRKKTCKTVLVDNVFFLLVMRARARQLFSQKQFISFLVSPISAPPPPPPYLKKKFKIQKIQKKRKKGKPMTGLSALKSVFRFRVVRSEFQKSKSRFPNRIRRPFYLQKLVVSCHGNGCF